MGRLLNDPCIMAYRASLVIAKVSSQLRFARPTGPLESVYEEPAAVATPCSSFFFGRVPELRDGPHVVFEQVWNSWC
jgi:hypothetical protein